MLSLFNMNQGCYHIKQVASRAFESFVTRVSGYAWLIENGTAYWDFLDGLLKRFLNDLGFLLHMVGEDAYANAQCYGDLTNVTHHKVIDGKLLIQNDSHESLIPFR